MWPGTPTTVELSGTSRSTTGACADAAIFADGDVAQDLRAGANHDIVADRRMPFPVFLARAAQGHALVQRDIVANDHRLAIDHTHTVVDEQTPPNLRAGMDFNTGDQARSLR